MELAESRRKAAFFLQLEVRKAPTCAVLCVLSGV
jgi:hypothetical protein